MRRWLFVGLILLLSVSGVNACSQYYYDIDGYGTFGCSGSTSGNVYLYYHGSTSTSDRVHVQWHASCSCDPFRYGVSLNSAGSEIYDKEWHSGDVNPNSELSLGINPSSYVDYSFTIIATPADLTEYTISGDTSCVDWIHLYIYTNDGYTLCDSKDGNGIYSFNILDTQQYNLVFSDGKEYEFTCTGDINYGYDACLYVYGYTCNIYSISLWKYEGGSWAYQGVASQWKGYDTYEMPIVNGYNYRLNFSDGHTHFFTCAGGDIRYDWDRCVWVYPPSPWQDPEIIQPILGYDNNIVFMRDNHGNFIKNSQIAVYNKANHTYNKKWTDTSEPYVLLAANNDSDDDVIVMCKTFNGVFTLQTTDPAFGTDENITWTNWTIPIMYNLEIRPIDQSKVPLYDVFVSMYEYTPLDPLSFFGYDTYWGHVPITNCSGFSRCDIVAEKGDYADYNITGLNWTSKSAMIKDYKQDIVMVKE